MLSRSTGGIFGKCFPDFSAKNWAAAEVLDWVPDGAIAATEPHNVRQIDRQTTVARSTTW